MIRKRAEQMGDDGIVLGGWGDGVTAFARAIPRLNTRANPIEKLTVLSLGFTCGTGQTAKHASRGHTNIGASLIGRVADQKRVIKRIIIR